jgi:hypothetical protein
VNLLVVLGVIALVAYAVWQKWRALPPQTKQLWSAIFGIAGAYRQMKKQGGATVRPNHEPPAVSSSLMVACVKCGLHVPENEGVRARGQFYCCAEHAQ